MNKIGCIKCRRQFGIFYIECKFFADFSSCKIYKNNGKFYAAGNIQNDRTVISQTGRLRIIAVKRVICIEFSTGIKYQNLPVCPRSFRRIYDFLCANHLHYGKKNGKENYFYKSGSFFHLFPIMSVKIFFNSGSCL